MRQFGGAAGVPGCTSTRWPRARRRSCPRHPGGSPADHRTIPTSPGTYQITATCFVNDGSGTAIAEYGPAAFEVTGDPAPTTTVPAPPAEQPEQPAPAAPVVATPTFTG